MMMKKIMTLGLSVIISAGVLLPVNAMPVKACGVGANGQTMERAAEYKVNRAYKNQSFRKNYRKYNKEHILERLNACIEYVETIYSEDKISGDIYNRIRVYLSQRIEKLEDKDNKESTPDFEEKIETTVPDKDTENKTTKDDITTDESKADETTTIDESTNKEEAANKGISAEEQKMVDLVNEARRKNGLEPLKVDTKVTELARMKSKDMIDNNYFSHNSPTYGSPFEMLKNYGVSYRSAGENIAGNQTVERAHVSLMNSPGHRRNILSADYTHIGIGIKDGGPYGKMFTQIFIKK